MKRKYKNEYKNNNLEIKKKRSFIASNVIEINIK